MAVRPKELRYAIDLRDELRTEDGTPLHADAAWTRSTCCSPRSSAAR